MVSSVNIADILFEHIKIRKFDNELPQSACRYINVILPCFDNVLDCLFFVLHVLTIHNCGIIYFETKILCHRPCIDFHLTIELNIEKIFACEILL